MHKLNFLDNEHLSCIYIHRFVDLTSDSLTYELALYPLQKLALDLWTNIISFLYEVVFHSLV